MNFRNTILCAALSATAIATSMSAQAQTVLKAADVHPPGYPTVVAT